MSTSRTLIGVALAVALAGCSTSSGPWPEDLSRRLAAPRLDPGELEREAWGVADPAIQSESLPGHLWSYDGFSRIYHDRRRGDVFIAYDGDHARWVSLTPARARLEFDPARARLVPLDTVVPEPGGGEP